MNLISVDVKSRRNVETCVPDVRSTFVRLKKPSNNASKKMIEILPKYPYQPSMKDYAV